MAVDDGRHDITGEVALTGLITPGTRARVDFDLAIHQVDDPETGIPPFA